jgi:hypothetical protein
MTYPLYLVHSEVGRDLALLVGPAGGPIVAILIPITGVLVLSLLILKAEKYPRLLLSKLLSKREKVEVVPTLL